ncbi:peptidoglycan editing factor PgeF [Vulgatibacter incomptus]|uniref:Purine nucleoside phosphorylase n=1 Tax=Vulgatibacter incomptus TaxID=1391653 RepID=A0A0K1PC98_9BACT|nr:peptidoglycan editing factor PgeF [Vulgatibacter incomptus]AKU91041.1 hypothetical protein AKJ08_1428 [Vulgatibacter incomptus]
MTTPDELEILRSERFAAAGIAHGFSTRGGGVSTGPLASLNLGGSVGDDPGAVEENHRRLARAAGFERGAFRSAVQVHGSRVLVLGADAPIPPGEEADAILAAAPGLAVAIRTADCVPILLADPRTGRVAAVHAGWRGTEAGIAAEAVRALAELGSAPSELIAAIGPAIGPCCYEVSSELADRFVRLAGPEVVEGRRLDLILINRLQLRAAGIPEASIEQVGGCTSCDDSRFFSHRRDAGRTGRHLSFVFSG